MDKAPDPCFFEPGRTSVRATVQATVDESL